MSFYGVLCCVSIVVAMFRNEYGDHWKAGWRMPTPLPQASVYFFPCGCLLRSNMHPTTFTMGLLTRARLNDGFLRRNLRRVSSLTGAISATATRWGHSTDHRAARHVPGHPVMRIVNSKLDSGNEALACYGRPHGTSSGSAGFSRAVFGCGIPGENGHEERLAQGGLRHPTHSACAHRQCLCVACHLLRLISGCRLFVCPTLSCFPRTVRAPVL